MRMYNTRLARFFSVDPITKEYPELTPYQFASNTPIMADDQDGQEGRIKITIQQDGNGNPIFSSHIEVVKDGQINQTSQIAQQANIKNNIPPKKVGNYSTPIIKATNDKRSPQQQQIDRNKSIANESFSEMANSNPLAYKFGAGIVKAPEAVAVVFGGEAFAGIKAARYINGLVSAGGNAVGQLATKSPSDFDLANTAGSFIGGFIGNGYGETLKIGINSSTDFTLSNGFKTSFNGSKPFSDVAIETGTGIIFNGTTLPGNKFAAASNRFQYSGVTSTANSAISGAIKSIVKDETEP